MTRSPFLTPRALSAFDSGVELGLRFRLMAPLLARLVEGRTPDYLLIGASNDGKDVAGLSDKDATLITFGRTLYRDHRVSSELWQKMIGHFGRQHTVQLMMIMGDYFRVGFMMNAVDQHLPPERFFATRLVLASHAPSAAPSERSSASRSPAGPSTSVLT